MRRAICSRNGNVDYTCRLLKSFGYVYIINTPTVDLESFLKNLLTKFCAVVAHDLLLQKITPSSLFIGSVIPPPNSHHDGIYADILRNPSDLSPQLDYCSVAIAVTHVTTNANDRCVRKVRKEELIFLMLIENFDFFN